MFSRSPRALVEVRFFPVVLMMHASFIFSVIGWTLTYFFLIFYAPAFVSTLSSKARRIQILITSAVFLFVGFLMLVTVTVISGLSPTLKGFLHVGISTTTIFSTNTLLIVLFYHQNRHQVNLILLATLFFGGAIWYYTMYGVHERLLDLNVNFLLGDVPQRTVIFLQLLSMVLLFYSIFLVILFLKDIVKRIQYQHMLGKESLFFSIGEVFSILSMWTTVIAFNDLRNIAIFLGLGTLLGFAAVMIVLMTVFINPNAAFIDFLVIERMLTKKAETQNAVFGFVLYYVGTVGPEIYLADFPSTTIASDHTYRNLKDILEEIGIKSMTQIGLGSEYGDTVHRFNLQTPIKGSFIFLTTFGITKSVEAIDRRFGNTPYLGFAFFVTDPQFEWLLDRTDAWKRVMALLKEIPLEEITKNTLIKAILDAIQYMIAGSW